MEVIPLLPLSQSEIHGSAGNFLERLFEGRRIVLSGKPVVGDELIDLVVAGGYPEAIRTTPKRRATWLEDYVALILDRDVQDIA